MFLPTGGVRSCEVARKNCQNDKNSLCSEPQMSQQMCSKKLGHAACMPMGRLDPKLQ